MNRSFGLLFGCLAALALTGVVSAQEASNALNEQLVMIPKLASTGTLALETTLYKPPGAGPFPLVVINHGKAAGDARAQARYQPNRATRFFLQRGYAVAVPMRQGFSQSQGNYNGAGCNIERNGRLQAEDIKATLDYLTAQPWADKQRILVLGQSHGGWTTLAFGAQGYPGVKGLVNFAGGLRQKSCTDWEGNLARASAAYGQQTTLPSLWFYGDNDSYFSSATFRAMYANYVANGAHAELVAFGRLGKDAHSMFASKAGESIWQPRVEAFMKSLGLPTEVVYAQFAAPAPMPIPPASDFAELDAVESLPYVREAGRAGYRRFLSKQLPRAFAISPNGAWAWTEMGDDPLRRALDNCNKYAKNQSCRLYAVDEQVVWIDK